MDWTALKNLIIDLFLKYKYVVMILLAGLILMLMPAPKINSTAPKDIKESVDNTMTLEKQLSDILKCVKGAGEVQVILTVAAGEEILYQTNDDYSNNGDSGSTRTDTVTVTDSNREETGLIRQVNPPTYLGAIIVCQGADRPEVRLAIVDAVSKATGLGTDRISVLKMK